jgi:hypothetical protein
VSAARLLASFGLVLLCACTWHRTELDALPRASAMGLRRGGANLREVLRRFGPPADFANTAEGFALIYQSARISELQASATWRVLRATASQGEGRFTRVAILFNREGEVITANSDSRPFDLGWGAAGGHRWIEDPFFSTRSYDQAAQADHRWAFETLSAPGADLPSTPNRDDPRGNESPARR